MEFAARESPRLNKTTYSDMLKRIFEQGNTNEFVSYFEFCEIIFEISQEMDVDMNISNPQKLKDYIEKVIMLGVRYRLCGDKNE